MTKGSDEIVGAPSRHDVGDALPSRDDNGTVVRVVGLQRRFDDMVALNGVDFEVRRGQIHALLGPNGAGKTTLLRILVGLVEPDDGQVEVMGHTWDRLNRRSARKLFGLIPATDRSFYLRLSGRENLIFFGRLYGLGKRAAERRAVDVLESVGLTHASDRQVGKYSHGMQKRLAVARSLLLEPPVLLIDEATHDLDPQGADQVRRLVRGIAATGAGVIWTTQRVEEVRGFADLVTIIDRGRVRFHGTVPQLSAMASGKRFVLRVERPGMLAPPELDEVRASIGRAALVDPDSAPGYFTLELADGIGLSDIITRLDATGIRVRGLEEQVSAIEQAFLQLTGEST